MYNLLVFYFFLYKLYVLIETTKKNDFKIKKATKNK